MRSYYKEVSLEKLCGLFGKTRQAYYDNKNRQEQKSLEYGLVLDLVKRERAELPRLGVRKLYYLLGKELALHNIQIGRDRFFDLLRAKGLLIRPKRRRRNTTNSRHRFKRFPNLIKDKEPIKAELIWVSDITYIRLKEEFCYLMLITDTYSHQIMGWSLSPNLGAQFCVDALKKAIAQRKYPSRKLIHHSDRGIQYCSDIYVKTLQKANVQISMTEQSDPYENAIAERMNGILKDEFNLDSTFDNIEQVQLILQKAVKAYNEKRPHSSCDFHTPIQAHQLNGPLKKRWKTTV